MDHSRSRNRAERKAFGIFMTSLAVTMVVLLSGIFIATAAQSARQVDETILGNGRSLFRELVLARRWAAGYGGVYVRKGPGVESNPWLVNPDLEAADGSMLTLRNPSLMTKEISALAARDEGFHFHITSLRPLNPGNAPDAFERAALERFEAGEREYWDTVDGPGGREFRYMGALMTEESCLQCHAVQGYQAGQVRGGISVSFSAEDARRKRSGIALAMGLSGALVLLATLGLVFGFVTRLRRKLDKTRAELEKAAVTDPLTGLYNRRYGIDRFARELEKARRLDYPVSCALLDADDFKHLNDSYGHLAGDEALRTIAACLREGIRPYDIPMRFGGEEFVLIFPGVRAEEAYQVCERLRARVSEGRRTLSQGPLTVSIGLAAHYPWMECAIPDREGPSKADSAAAAAASMDALADELLRRADAAMYRAKSEGKNRTVLE